MRKGKQCGANVEQVLFDFCKPEAATTGETSHQPSATVVALFLTPRDLLEQFRIPLSTQKVYRWQTAHNLPNNPGLPFVKIGRRVLYPRGEILDWIYSGRVGGVAGATLRKSSK